MPSISLLSCTDRPDSNALNITREIEEIYHSKGMDVTLHTLEEFPLADVAGGRYGESIASVEAFNDKVLDSDGLVLVTPEYNGGFPGILKLFIDYLPFPEAMEGRPVCLVGEAAGYFGAHRPVEQIQDLLIYRKAHVYPERVFLPRVNDLLDEQEALSEEAKVERLQKQADGFIRFVRLLRTAEA